MDGVARAQPGVQEKGSQQQRLPGNNEQQSYYPVTARGEMSAGGSLDKRGIRKARANSSVDCAKSREGATTSEQALQTFGSSREALLRLAGLKLGTDIKVLGEGNWGEVIEVMDNDQNTLALKHHPRKYAKALKVDPDRGPLLRLALKAYETHTAYSNLMDIKFVLIGEIKHLRYQLITSPEQLHGDIDNYYVSCVVSEKAAGMSLKRFIKDCRCNENEIAKIFLQLTRVVAFLHSCSCAHRDISAANLMYDSKTGLLKLIDFGTLKKGLERTYSIVGAFQLLDKDCGSGGGCDPVRLDLWEMGVVMLYCLTGGEVSRFNGTNQSFDFPASNREHWTFCTNMFVNKTDLEKKKIITSHLKASLKDMNPECLDIVVKLLDADPSRRPSAQDAADKLEAIYRQMLDSERDVI